VGKGSSSAESSAGADALWAVAGDFGGIAEWFPGVGSLRVDGDDRFIDMGGTEICEHLFERDAATRTLLYGVVGSEGIAHHRCRVTVAPAGTGSTVTMDYEVEPDALLPMFDDVYGQAVEALVRHVG